MVDDYLKGKELDEQLYFSEYIDCDYNEPFNLELTKKEKREIDSLMKEFINLMYKVPKEITRIIKAIESNRFNLDRPTFSYYGVSGTITPLHCSYGQIGYKIYIKELNTQLTYDFEKQEFTYIEY